MSDSRAPKVTVVIPVYNRQDKILRAIDSVVKQSYENFIIHVVDDCSTDGTLQLLKSLDEPRLNVIQMVHNSGAAAARNKGISESNTAYIALLDSDDLYHPDFLKISLSNIEQTIEEIGYTYSGVGDIHNLGHQGSINVWTPPARFQSFKKPFLYQLKIGTAAGVVIKKSVFEKAGFFDESFKVAEDTDWFIRVSEFFKGLAIPQILIYKDNSSPDRLTSRYAGNALSYKMLIEKHRNDIEASQFLVRRWFYKSMWLNYYSGNKKQAYSDFAAIRKADAVSVKIFFIFVAGAVLNKNTFIAFHKKVAGLK